MSAVTLHLSLEPDHAAALARLCAKFANADAAAYLYPHVDKETRVDQACQMVRATLAVSEALTQAGVRGWPWVETGSAG